MLSYVGTDITWQWSSFSALSRDQIYAILQARQQVFVVEQHCEYLDADDKDQDAWHLCAWQSSEQKNLLAYLRVLKPGVRYTEASIGRVLTTAAARGQGLGKQLVEKGIAHTQAELPQQAIRISAQAYLQKFYADFGFIAEGDPYMEEGIEHIEMLLPA